jgi:hypothetical protein
MNEILEGQKDQQPSSMITIIGRFDDFTDMAVDISPQLQLARILGFDSSGNMTVKLGCIRGTCQGYRLTGLYSL